ncbi:hypothetical protein Taro_007752 [Colocasia esculenta]|uniref:DM2 domain-containing protein n=1 Tax=Colocasia esculenta TaxID=4460 RepID=A0A843TZU6_COLES|nr:hypothetical protein [Colocasia esculenta]
MVTDQEIASCVESLLRQGDPGVWAAASVNVNGVVQQVEAKLGVDLSHKAGFIRDQINLLLRAPPPAPAPLKGAHFALHHPPQQQQLHQLQQQQFLAGHSHQLLRHHQVPQSPFAQLPQQHELTFRCAPAVTMQPHPLLQQQQVQQPQPAAAVAGVTVAKPEGHVATGSAAAPAATKGSSASGTKRRGGPGGLRKLCGVSPELQAIVGEPALPRTEASYLKQPFIKSFIRVIVKQLWAYIRKNNLQDPNNKRKIICNDELRLVFETDSTDMFKMNKLLAKHIIPLEAAKEAGPNKKKLKTVEVASGAEAEAEQMPLVISDELAKFFGSGEREMTQSEAVKRVWDYINTYQLKDPLNPKMVHCDAKLQQLFGCDSLSQLGVNEMLAHHLFKQ